MRMLASVDSARTAMRHSWNICAETVCAAAAVPVASIVSIARITARNVMFCAMDRICTAAPPTMSFPMFPQLGTRISEFRVTIPRFSIVLRYNVADITSDADVAIAAPATPIALMNPPPKMSSGSSTRFTVWLRSVIFIGVVTSSVPRNAAKPTVETIAGTNVSARQPMYGAAMAAVSDPGTTPTTDSAPARNTVNRAIPKTPTREATKMASPVARWTSSVSPLAAAFATTGAMMDGTNEIIQNAL
mmetsp:Transcript_4268/g.15028  ORF Transcript_4268/g.15028 Transcript_4268/m.15028 type:complete len:246 (+) Transcript_4268:597-1334(+)